MLTLLFFLGGGGDPLPAAQADTHDGAGYIYQSPERRRLADKADRAKLVDAQGIAATIREQLVPKSARPVVKVSVAFDFEADDEEALLWLI